MGRRARLLGELLLRVVADLACVTRRLRGRLIASVRGQFGVRPAFRASDQSPQGVLSYSQARSRAVG